MHRCKSALFLTLGLALLATALYFGLDTQSFMAEAQRARGQVVALNAEARTRRSPSPMCMANDTTIHKVG